jgi:hypothetical protein
MREHHSPDKPPHAMKQVKLSLTDEAGNLVESVSATLTGADISLLQKYVYRVGQVRLCKLLVREMPSLTSLGTIMRLNLDPYSSAELHELLHLLTPVILPSEAASLHNISGLLSQKFLSSNFADNLSVVRQIFDHGDQSLYRQISEGGQQLFHMSLLNTDVKGRDAKAGFEEDLNLNKERYIGISQLQGKVKALFMLEYIVNLVLESSREAEIINKGD